MGAVTTSTEEPAAIPPERVLLVDDDERLLSIFERMLKRRFRVATASSGAKAIEMILREGPFAVVVSDLHMPEMSGIELLSKVRALSPDTVRAVFTAHRDAESAIDLVNRGNIYLYLVKPSSGDAVAEAIGAAIAHHRFQTCEREMLEATLRGGVTVLTDILATLNPAGFRRVQRLKNTVSRVAAKLGRDRVWVYELAAMLAEIGPTILTTETFRKVSGGWMLPGQDNAIIKACVEYEHLRERGAKPCDALNVLRASPTRFEDAVVAALEKVELTSS